MSVPIVIHFNDGSTSAVSVPDNMVRAGDIDILRYLHMRSSDVQRIVRVS